MEELIATIFAAARANGISQKELAVRAGIAEETLSRLKHKSSLRTSVLEALAHSVGLRLALVVIEEPVRTNLQPGWSSETGWFSPQACRSAKLTWPQENEDEFRV